MASVNEQTIATSSIRLVFRSAPDTSASPAIVGEVARRVTAGLRENNQRVEPVYDGTRGGELYRWMVEVASAAQPLLPLAQLALTLAQLLNEVRKSATKSPADRQPPVLIVVRHVPPPVTAPPDSSEPTGTARPAPSQVTVPPDSNQALLEQLLSEHLPGQTVPSHITIEVQVAPPPQDEL